MRPIALPALTLILVGCDSTGAADHWAGRVDTLPGGTLVVTNPARGLWDSTSTWRLEETLRIGRGEGDGPDLFGDVAALEVDPLGRVYVLESQADEIRVFDRNGRFVRMIGRRGGGPGEFGLPAGLMWDGEGRLWVADVRNARYSAFDTAGGYLGERRRRASFFRLPFPGLMDAEGRVYDTGLDAMGSAETLVRFDDDPPASDTFPLPTFAAEQFEIPGRVTVVVPFSASLRWKLGPGPELWFGVTGEYRIYRRTLDGDTLAVIGREYQAPPVTAAQRDSAVEALDWFTEEGGRIDPSRFPRSHPAFHDFTVDDRGFLWVRPAESGAAPGTVFDVFDPEGRYLGAVRSTAPIPLYAPLLIRGREVYTVTRDDLDVPYVIRLEIVGRE